MYRVLSRKQLRKNDVTKRLTRSPASVIHQVAVGSTQPPVVGFGIRMNVSHLSSLSASLNLRLIACFLLFGVSVFPHEMNTNIDFHIEIYSYILSRFISSLYSSNVLQVRNMHKKNDDGHAHPSHHATTMNKKPLQLDHTPRTRQKQIQKTCTTERPTRQEYRIMCFVIVFFV